MIFYYSLFLDYKSIVAMWVAMDLISDFNKFDIKHAHFNILVIDMEFGVFEFKFMVFADGYYPAVAEINKNFSEGINHFFKRFLVVLFNFSQIFIANEIHFQMIGVII